jgi:protein TonB
MENVSIYGKKWLDLVFEGRNKEYGAYQMRKENSKTTLKAFFFGSFILCGLTFILSSFSNTEIATPILEETYVPVVMDDIIFDTKPEIEKPKLTENNSQSQAAPLQTPTTPINSGTMVVATTILSQESIPTNNELAVAPIAFNSGNIGTGLPNSNSGNSNSGEITGVVSSNPYRTSVLDVQPAYPGGIKRFYQFVGENFNKDRDYEGKTVRVNVAFVIEKNGLMTDIKVLEDTNSDVSKEAIRVLKSLKTKWSPGIKNGQPVRTQFTLPITVQL